jgi:AMP deaminase
MTCCKLNFFINYINHTIIFIIFKRKAFCLARLESLKSKFELHSKLNKLKEAYQQRLIPHRDFYNVRKVDTHIHAASSMNQKHLLNFIKNKLKTNPDMVVIQHETKGPLTLKQVFDDMNLTPYDLSIDRLSMHAVRDPFLFSVHIEYFLIYIFNN